MTENTGLEKYKKYFIENEIWGMVLLGAFQRSKIYKNGIQEKDKKEFKSELNKYIQNLVEKYYINGTDEGQHVKNIEDLCRWASDNYGKKILKDGRLRIGTGQKILNLYLKYLWCLNKVALPPHCPLDRSIIKEVDSKSETNWTELDDIDEYKKIIRAVKKKANPKSLSEWELEIYEKNRNK